MSKLDETSVADVGRWLGRFAPYLALVATIVAVIAFIPGDDDGAGDVAAGGFGGAASPLDTTNTTGGTTGADGGADGTLPDTADGTATTDVTSGGRRTSGTGTGGGGVGGAGTQTTTGGVGGGATTPGAPGASGAGLVANCDPATGRIKIPSFYAPPCVRAFSGDNGGSTYRGITGDTIKIAVYRAQDDPAAQAILSAAGVRDEEEEIRQQYRDFVEFFETHFETYGRHVELTFVPGSGKADDDAAARADAIKVAEEIGAFASWEAPSNTYVDELVARGVMCFCTTSQPADNYLRWAPYVWSGSLMSSSNGYVHRAEYLGRLGRNKAIHAGDPLIQQKPRVYGLFYFETDDKAYEAGVDFFEQELKKYNLDLAVRAAYKGFPDVAATQEQARPLIQKMKEAGATSLLCACDPFAPIFFTQEATRQQYFPEWVVIGAALTDTSLFARTYDQTQWENAFGLSYLPARLPDELSDMYRLLEWHFGKPPVADDTYGVWEDEARMFYNGVQLAGPNLNPQTFQQAMFTDPIRAQGHIVFPTSSFGRKGIWDFDDYTEWDDATEIWWDPQARGEDEIGNDGQGLYRYVNGGVRYLPTQWPKTPPNVFTTEGTVLIFETYPPGDEPPEYPPPKR